MAGQPKPENTGVPAVIFDLDGTLCHTSVRYPAAHTRDLLQDEVDETVRGLLDRYSGSHNIVLVTGRKAEQLDTTMKWLAKHGVHYDRLFSRADGDNRDDSEVKRGLYMDHICGVYRVDAVFDDRPRVIRMWRGALGLRVFDCGDGVEF